MIQGKVSRLGEKGSRLTVIYSRLIVRLKSTKTVIQKVWVSGSGKVSRLGSRE